MKQKLPFVIMSDAQLMNMTPMQWEEVVARTSAQLTPDGAVRMLVKMTEFYHVVMAERRWLWDLVQKQGAKLGKRVDQPPTSDRELQWSGDFVTYSQAMLACIQAKSIADLPVPMDPLNRAL